jgi:nitroreductase
MSRAAETSTPILPVLAQRWSPRSFDPTKSLTMAELTPAFEAARWAPSANNAQEWRFLVGFRGDATFEAMTEHLSGWNASWAPSAGAIVVGIYEDDPENKSADYAPYDLGQAVAYFSVQAHADGLFVHQAAGFDRDAMAAHFNVPATWKVFVVAVVGHLGAPELLNETLLAREIAPRVRRPLDETVFLGPLPKA